MNLWLSPRVELFLAAKAAKNNNTAFSRSTQPVFCGFGREKEKDYYFCRSKGKNKSLNSTV